MNEINALELKVIILFSYLKFKITHLILIN